MAYRQGWRALRVVVTAGFLCSEAFPQEPVGAAILAISGRQILQDADKMLENRIFQLEQAGNGMVNRLTTNLSVLSEGARINMKDVLDRPLKDMQEAQRNVFIAIREATAEVGKAVGAAYKLEEIANIDVAQRLSAIPLVKSVVFTSSINGLAVLKWTPSHTISIIATGLGPGQAGRKAQVKFFLNGQQMQPDQADLTKHNEGRYTFSMSQFIPYFRPREPRTLDLVAQLVVEDEAWLKVFPSKTQYVNTHVFLTLFPEYAGSATVSFKVPTYGWRLVERREEGRRARDCGNSKCGGGGANEDWSTTPVPNGETATPAPGHRKVASPAMRCGDPWWDPAGCQYVYDHRTTLSANKDRVDAHWRITGVWVTMYVSYDVLEWAKIGEEVKTLTLDLAYDKNVDFCVPDSVDYYVVSAKSITNQAFEETPGKSNGLLQYSGPFTCEGSGKRHSYKVVRPL